MRDGHHRLAGGAAVVVHAVGRADVVAALGHVARVPRLDAHLRGRLRVGEVGRLALVKAHRRAELVVRVVDKGVALAVRRLGVRVLDRERVRALWRAARRGRRMRHVLLEGADVVARGTRRERNAADLLAARHPLDGLRRGKLVGDRVAVSAAVDRVRRRHVPRALERAASARLVGRHGVRELVGLGGRLGGLDRRGHAAHLLWHGCRGSCFSLRAVESSEAVGVAREADSPKGQSCVRYTKLAKAKAL